MAASATDADGDTLSFTWSQTAGPSVDFTDNGETINFNAPDIAVDTDLGFTVDVSDGQVQTSASGVVSVININEVPIANAGGNQEVPENVVVSLSGGGTDSDGSVESFVWRQLSGAPISLRDSTQSIASFTSPTVTDDSSLVFELEVTDNDGGVATDELEIIVNKSSTILSLSPEVVEQGDLVVISGEKFSGTEGVTFGGIPVGSFEVVNDGRIDAVVGVGISGNVSVESEARGKADFQAITVTDYQCENDVNGNIFIALPGCNDRYFFNDIIEFNATVSSDVDPSQLVWTSSLDGDLGNGGALTDIRLSKGVHEISITNAEMTYNASINVRIFETMDEMYFAAPSENEIARIMQDFNIVYQDNTNESWDQYEPSHFNQIAVDPTKIELIAQMDMYRRMTFSEPLPIPTGSQYDLAKQNVNNIIQRLDCGFAFGGGGRVSLGRSQGAQTGFIDFDTCRGDGAGIIRDWVPFFIMDHEARHNEPNDPRHIICESNGFQGDEFFEGGSGFARSALVLLWYYEYGENVGETSKELSLRFARGILTRICNTPTHSDPRVQALLDEALNPEATASNKPTNDVSSILDVHLQCDHTKEELRPQ